MMSREIDNTQDVLDSRDIIARIEELTSQRDELQRDIDEAKRPMRPPPTMNDRTANSGMIWKQQSMR